MFKLNIIIPYTSLSLCGGGQRYEAAPGGLCPCRYLRRGILIYNIIFLMSKT